MFIVKLHYLHWQSARSCYGLNDLFHFYFSKPCHICSCFSKIFVKFLATGNQGYTRLNWVLSYIWSLWLPWGIKRAKDKYAFSCPNFDIAKLLLFCTNCMYFTHAVRCWWYYLITIEGLLTVKTKSDNPQISSFRERLKWLSCLMLFSPELFYVQYQHLNTAKSVDILIFLRCREQYIRHIVTITSKGLINLVKKNEWCIKYVHL